jgi:hypothetical protein
MTGEPTKPDLVAHVRAITEAAERKDVDAIVAYFSADALCETRFMMTRGRSTPPEATWHGAPGNARPTWEAFVKWHMGWPEHEWNIKQIGDRIVLLVSHHFRRFDWGIMGTQEAASIFE